MPAHTESHFEAAIEHHLTTHGGYRKRSPGDYAEEWALSLGMCGASCGRVSPGSGVLCKHCTARKRKPQCWSSWQGN